MCCPRCRSRACAFAFKPCDKRARAHLPLADPLAGGRRRRHAAGPCRLLHGGPGARRRRRPHLSCDIGASAASKRVCCFAVRLPCAIPPIRHFLYFSRSPRFEPGFDGCLLRRQHTFTATNRGAPLLISCALATLLCGARAKRTSASEATHLIAQAHAHRSSNWIDA